MNMSKNGGLEIVHSADLPALSGLGSSSTFTVCFLHALHSLKNENVSKTQLQWMRAVLEKRLAVKEL